MPVSYDLEVMHDRFDDQRRLHDNRRADQIIISVCVGFEDPSPYIVLVSRLSGLDQIEQAGIVYRPFDHALTGMVRDELRG